MIDTSNLAADGPRSLIGYSAYNSHVSPRTTPQPREVHLMLEPSPPSYRAPPANVGTYYTRVLEDAGDDQPGTSRSDHERAPMSPSWRGGSPYQSGTRQTAVVQLQSRVMKLQRLVTSERQNSGELRELLDRGERRHRQRELELGERINLLESLLAERQKAQASRHFQPLTVAAVESRAIEERAPPSNLAGMTSLEVLQQQLKAAVRAAQASSVPSMDVAKCLRFLLTDALQLMERDVDGWEDLEYERAQQQIRIDNVRAKVEQEREAMLMVQAEREAVAAGREAYLASKLAALKTMEEPADSEPLQVGSAAKGSRLLRPTSPKQATSPRSPNWSPKAWVPPGPAPDNRHVLLPRSPPPLPSSKSPKRP